MIVPVPSGEIVCQLLILLLGISFIAIFGLHIGVDNNKSDRLGLADSAVAITLSNNLFLKRISSSKNPILSLINLNKVSFSSLFQLLQKNR